MEFITKVKANLEESIHYLDETFQDCDDIVKRKFPAGIGGLLYISYIDTLVDRDLIEQHIMNRLMFQTKKGSSGSEGNMESFFETLKNNGITTADLKETEDLDEIVLGLMSGDTVLLVDGVAKAILISTKSWPNRGITTTETEVVVQGSKEAFSEVFRFNTVLIRRRIRDSKLKIKQLKVGRRSSTDIALVYLDDVVRPSILAELQSRIGNIDVDAILDSGYIAQFIEDDWISPFPQIQVTERPDKASAAILEGRIVIVVDNSPFVLIVPSTMNTFFQSSEDYYERWQIMSFVRALRFVAAFMAVTFPGLYIALAVYHPSMIPMPIALKMAAARESVPFPAIVEILLMDIAFELIREAGIRLPGPVGGAIGIIGGLIVGQAAVEAGIVSPVVVIIIAITGICSFTIPHISLVSAFRLIKYFIIALAAVLGFFGFWLALLCILIHLAALKSFGIPYLYPFTSGDVNRFSDLKDTFFRFPTFTMRKRPIFSTETQRTRLSKTGIKHKKE